MAAKRPFDGPEGWFPRSKKGFEQVSEFDASATRAVAPFCIVMVEFIDVIRGHGMIGLLRLAGVDTADLGDPDETGTTAPACLRTPLFALFCSLPLCRKGWTRLVLCLLPFSSCSSIRVVQVLALR